MVQNLNFQPVGDRLPPQNIDAEEAILGGILLDPEAINRVMEILQPDAFYIGAHRDIYRAALDLHHKGRPTDLMSITSWLKDQGKLEKVGGQVRLAQLVDRTVSAANIDQYSALVMEKYMRRKLIHVGGDIVQLGFETETALENVLDQAEQKLFGITQDRPQAGLMAAADILTETFSDIEQRSLGLVLPGVACGFYDLDAMTQGFQRSDLIIAAGRPSMGKTAMCLNVAYNIAVLHKLPVAVFSLEMSKAQLVYRLLSSEARIESGRLRAGRIAQDEWESLGHAISKLSQLPIFIDDTPNISVNEMRSKTRRLQAEQGGSLGLVLIDYLQLMEGGGDNRVQELSKITRSLKGLARELNVPIIALSQLSRGVESRTNKRPMMSDLRESGCLTGDTIITLADQGIQVPLRDLVGQSGFAVWTLNEQTYQIERACVSHVFTTGEKPVFKLLTRLGRVIRATANHPFLTIQGWKRLDELACGMRVALPRQLAMQAVGMKQREMQASLGMAYCGTTLYRQNLSRERIQRVASVLNSELMLHLAQSDVYWDEIVAIEPDGIEPVYDMTVPVHHNFVANEIIVHNSIEQDADVIMMLYREEYYDPDTPDRGIAEVIVTKHRNGPVGTVKLLFQPEFTQFLNYSPPPSDR